MKFGLVRMLPEIFKKIDDIDLDGLISRTIEGLDQEKNEKLFSYAIDRYQEYFKKDYIEALKNISQYKSIFAFTGKLTRNPDGGQFKGVDRIIDAARLLSKVREDFCITLCGNGELYEELIDTAYKQGLKNMFFLGYQDNASVIPYWNNLGVAGLYPSRNEPFGLVAIECAACYTPPITSREGGFLSFIEQCGGAMVSEYPQEFCDAMNNAIEEDWKNTRTDLFAYTVNFSWKKIAEEIEESILDKV